MFNPAGGQARMQANRLRNAKRRERDPAGINPAARWSELRREEQTAIHQ
jgi:hypothetical protein